MKFSVKKISVVLSGFLLMTCKPVPHLSKPEITVASVAEKMNFLASDALEGRNTGEEGIEKAAVYIENFFKEHKVAPYFSTYRDSLIVRGATAYNVVGVVPGNDATLKDEFIMIGAHYDHVGMGKAVDGDTIFNGANDNASGTVAVMELARYFGHSKTNKRSLVFALFSAEEKGLLGSAHLAEKLKRQNFNLYVMVNFEMIGVPMTKPYKAYITGYELSDMAAKINEYSGKNTIGFLPTAKKYALFRRSDNYPFYTQFKVPCQTVSSFDFTNFDYYHHVDDEASAMDFEHMAALINEMVLPLERMANTATREIQMNE